MSCAIETAGGPGSFQPVNHLLLHQFQAPQLQEKQQQQEQQQQQQKQQTIEQTQTLNFVAPLQAKTICDNHHDDHIDDQQLIISNNNNDNNTPLSKCSTFTPASGQRTIESTPSAVTTRSSSSSSCILRKQRQQQQQQQCQARDSLESLRSRASSSSSPCEDAGSPPEVVGVTSVLVATRYVEPPRVATNDASSKIQIDSFKGVQNNNNNKSLTHLQQEDFGRDTPTPVATPHRTSPAHHRHPDDVHESNYKSGEPIKSRKSLDLDRPQQQQQQQQQQAPPQQIGKVKAPFLFAGILASILGSLFFSIGILCIKLLPDGQGMVDKTQFICFRGLVMLGLCTFTLWWQNTTFLIRRDEWLINALRSVFGFAGVFGVYISLKYISMGDATALVFSSPVWTSLLSHFILHEPLQWIQLMALPASLVGIVLIAHPALLINMEHTAGYTERQPSLDLAEALDDERLPLAELLVGPLKNSNNNMTSTSPEVVVIDSETILEQAANQTAHYLANHTSTLMHTLNSDLDISTNTSEHFDFEHRWKGIVIAIATSFIVSLVYIVLKFRKSTPIQTTTFWLAVTTVIMSLLLMCFIGFGEWPASWLEWILILSNGICSWLGQILLQWAMSYEDASVLSVIRTLDVAMTFSLSALFLNEQILWTSILGASIIAAVVVSIMLNTWLTKKLCPGEGEEEQQQQQQQQVSENTEQPTLKSLEAGNGNGAMSRHSSVAA